jgi:hypothetical protein
VQNHFQETTPMEPHDDASFDRGHLPESNGALIKLTEYGAGVLIDA